MVTKWVNGSDNSWTSDSLLSWGKYEWTVEYWTDTSSGVASEGKVFCLVDVFVGEEPHRDV